VLQLSLYGLPIPVGGTELTRYRDELLVAARRASQALGSRVDHRKKGLFQPESAHQTGILR